MLAGAEVARFAGGIELGAVALTVVQPLNAESTRTIRMAMPTPWLNPVRRTGSTMARLGNAVETAAVTARRIAPQNLVKL